MEELDDGLLAELALPPSATVAFQAVKANQWEKNSKEELLSHIREIGSKVLGINVKTLPIQKTHRFPRGSY